MSPVLPKIGAASPYASKGPVMVQVKTVIDVWNSVATLGSATMKTVKVMLSASKPAKSAPSTHHG